MAVLLLLAAASRCRRRKSNDRARHPPVGTSSCWTIGRLPAPPYGRWRRVTRQHGGVSRTCTRRDPRFCGDHASHCRGRAARNPRVRYVEQDSERFIVDDQQNATWGLDRIDQRDLPLNGHLQLHDPGRGRSRYVIDTGIRSAHAEFGGRVSSTGYTAIADGTVPTTQRPRHACRRTIGGPRMASQRGDAARGARAQRSGSGSTSGVIAGVNWVTANHTAPAVANMSLAAAHPRR